MSASHQNSCMRDRFLVLAPSNDLTILKSMLSTVTMYPVVYARSLRNRCNCSRITSSAATFSNLWRFRAFVYNTELKCRSPRQTQYQQKRCLPLYKYTNKPLQRRKHNQCPHEEINSANINECLQNTSKQQQTVRNGFGFNANNVKEITRLNTSFPPLQIFSCLQKHLNVACVYLHFWQTMIFWKRQERHWSVEV